MQKTPRKTKLILRAFAIVSVSLGEIAIELAEFTRALGSGYGPAFQKGGAGYVSELKKLSQERELRNVLHQLKKQKYITEYKLGQRLMLKLTNKGVHATLATRLKVAPSLKRGECTLVAFDIPRTQNEARRQFRWLLRQGGFIKLQQSLWVSRADCHQTLTQLIQELKLQRWVSIAYAHNFLPPLPFIEE